MEWTDDPVAIGLDRDRFDKLIARAETWCETGVLPAIALTIGRPEQALVPWCRGRLHPEHVEKIDAETVFTIASITKPIVATAALLLLEDGDISLGEKVTRFVPEFRGPGRNRVRIRHLLSHTSGLPDLLPRDRDLRRGNASLEEFLAETCRTELLFPPGRSALYSSCGFLVLGELLARVAGQPLSELVRERIFQPLGMNRSELGAPSDWFEPNSGVRFADVRVPDEQAGGGDWNWNSRYWRTLGAPWGGMLSTIGDLAIFARMMLNDGRHDDRQFLSPASVALATGNALASMQNVPEAEARGRPWGLGWRLQWPAHGVDFGDLASADTYGHGGATGTVLWIDPSRELYAVILTTQPHGIHLTRLSNMILAALLDC